MAKLHLGKIYIRKQHHSLFIHLLDISWVVMILVIMVIFGQRCSLVICFIASLKRIRFLLKLVISIVKRFLKREAAGKSIASIHLYKILILVYYKGWYGLTQGFPWT